MKQELVINYDLNSGQSLEYWPSQEHIKAHGFYIMDNKNNEITQLWLNDKQARSLAYGILSSITNKVINKEMSK